MPSELDEHRGGHTRPGYDEMVRALLDASCYPHQVTDIQHIETHISHVFLTGQYAYKLKKPVELGFVDFSSLDKRRHFCEEEVRLNRRLAPDLYLGTVAITGAAAHPCMGGAGVPIEYAVQMLQFNQSGLLERLIARDALSSAQIDEIAHLVAGFHSTLPGATADSPYGTPEAVMGPAEQNFEQLAPLVQSTEERHALEQLEQWTAGQHAALASLFEERHRHGYVRECHGDLHLGNIAVVDGRVRIFDCIEFNPQLRWIDVMSEVAFLAMDLIVRKHLDFAYRFVDRYLQVTGDYHGVRLLRYYMVYRALVRAKVAAMRASQAGVQPYTQERLRDKCTTHVMLANRLAESTRPLLAILHGLSGSGKTAVSQVVLETIGAIRIRSDVERKRLHGLNRTAHSGAALAEGLYSPQGSELTYKRLAELAADMLDAGFMVLVDAAFLQQGQRDRFRALAQTKGVPFAILHAEAGEPTLRQRIESRAREDSDPSEASGAVLDWQLANQEPLTEAECRLTSTFDTETQSPTAAAEQVRDLFGDGGGPS